MTTRDVDFFALQLASGEVSGHDMIEMMEEAMEEVINTSTKILGMVSILHVTVLDAILGRWWPSSCCFLCFSVSWAVSATAPRTPAR